MCLKLVRTCSLKTVSIVFLNGNVHYPPQLFYLCILPLLHQCYAAYSKVPETSPNIYIVGELDKADSMWILEKTTSIPI